MSKAKKKKRADHYEDKLQINSSFEDVIKVSITLPPPAEKKEEEKPVQKKKPNKPPLMRKLLLFVSIALSFSCNKILGKTCWDCEVYRRDGSKYNDKVCTDDSNPPQFTDNNGNDLASYCTKR